MIFEKATRLKLRFFTEKGNLSIEDLWDLPLKELNKIAKLQNKKIKELNEEDFLIDETEENIIEKLKFDLALFILKTKKQEEYEIKLQQIKKLEKDKLLNIISKKQDATLEELTIEELKQKLEKL